MSTSNAAGINSLIAAITKLDGSNYYDWIFDVEMVARWAGTWDVIRGEPRPEKAREIAEWERKSNDALTMIGLSVAKSELVHIRGCKTAHEMWRSLEGVYAKNSQANRIALRQQLNTITLGAEDTVQAYVSRVSDTAAHMRSVGVDFSAEDEVDVLIMNLPETWGHVASSLLIRPGALKVQDVVGVLLEEETRRRHADAQAITSSALVARTGAGGRRGALGGGNGGSGSGSEGRKCYRCGQRGHIAAKCLAPQPTVLTEDVAVAVAPQTSMDNFNGLYAL
jgi:hypothetical protein